MDVAVRSRHTPASGQPPVPLHISPMGDLASPAKLKKFTVQTPPPPETLNKHHVHTAIMLYLVGLGLADEKDITVRGLEIVKKAERVYLEAYTAVLLVDKEALVSISSPFRQKSVIQW